MSQVVEDWVWHECPIEESRPRFVLLAIARHCANDDGTGSYPSINRLARMVRADRKTVMSSIAELEAAGELLVWRPDAPSKKRHNVYAVVMGRDPDDVRRLEEERHRPRPKAEQAATEPPQPAATARRRTGPQPVRNRSATGPEPVRPHAQRRTGREHEPEEERRASAARGSPARATPHDSRLDPLRAELAGVAVSWHMSGGQLERTAALLAIHGAPHMARVAFDQIAARSGPPTFARAWIPAWTEVLGDGSPGRDRSSDGLGQSVEVPEPRPAPWCTSCDSDGYRWEVNDAGHPLRPCPRCHPTARLPAPF